jgi:hypothetical protein
MKCSECHIENPSDNKFCRECGATMQTVCYECGNELHAGDKFCGNCGQKVVEQAKEETTRSTSEGERKHVTVLFSDLSGYTAMSEKLDPEEVKEITGRIFATSKGGNRKLKMSPVRNAENHEKPLFSAMKNRQ